MFRTSCTTCGGGGDPRYQGDYDAITSNKNSSMAVWSDYRNGNFGSFASYFPVFAMLASPAADTLGLTDSVTAVVKVPSVKLYSRYVKFTATLSPPANITLSFLGNRDSLTNYPDSVRLKSLQASANRSWQNRVEVSGSTNKGGSVSNCANRERAGARRIADAGCE